MRASFRVVGFELNLNDRLDSVIKRCERQFRQRL